MLLGLFSKKLIYLCQSEVQGCPDYRTWFNIQLLFFLSIFYSQLHVNGIEQQAMPMQVFYIILYYIILIKLSPQWSITRRLMLVFYMSYNVNTLFRCSILPGSLGNIFVNASLCLKHFWPRGYLNHWEYSQNAGIWANFLISEL